MPRYAREHHERAFDIYYKTRSKKQVAREMKITAATVASWATPEFKCSFGCQWHGWDRLAKQREAAIKARMREISRGNINPLNEQKVMEHAIAAVEDGTDPIVLQNTFPPIMDLVRDDFHRIQDWETIYAKAFYDATGISLTYAQIIGGVVEKTQEEDLWKAGKHASNFESAVRIMAHAQNQIDKIRGIQDSEERKEAELVQDGKTKKVYTLQHLRNLKKIAETASPEEVAELLKKTDD
jgi:hypothetical protein